MPNYRDGSGSRYLLGPLYLLVGDLNGALQHYEWYQKEFSGDAIEAFNHICWALVSLRSGNLEEARLLLIKTHLANNFILPALLGLSHGQPNIPRGCNWEEADYIAEGPLECLALWSGEELAWLHGEWDEPVFQRIRKRDLEITITLSTEKIGERRSKLVSEKFGLMNGIEEPVVSVEQVGQDNVVFLGDRRK